jgi:hypothetical protein
MSDNVIRNLNSRVGCHCWGTNPDSVAGVPVYAEVGCRWVRATRPMQMDVVATGPRQYNFADHGEASIDLAIANGMSIMGILDARWGNETLFNDLPYASPIWEHLDLWEDFVSASVNYYKDRVKYWEIINEPPFFWWYPTPEGVTIPEINPDIKRAPIWAYAKLLKASAKAIRAADPTAKVVMGSGFNDGQFLQRLYDLDCKNDFDIASVHYLGCKHPDDFARGYRRMRTVMAENGDADKAMWDTENGPMGAIIGQSVQTPGEYEALYNIYRHCFAHQFGLERYFWFNPAMNKEAGVSHGSDTYDANNQLSPAYQAMKTLYKFVGEGELLKNNHLDGEVHTYLFDGPQGPVSILWSTAPATARLSGKIDAFNYLGESQSLTGEFELNGQPLFIPGDISSTLDITLHGKRETVVPCMKQPPADTPQFTATPISTALSIHDAGWDNIPYLATRNEIPVTDIGKHFCKVTSSVTADIQIAFTPESLLLRVKTYDDMLNHACPTGLVQFTLRDSNPDIREWTYFYNSYGLYNLFASDRGSMVLRFEHLMQDEYPVGVVKNADIQVESEADGLLYCANIPWSEIGPCRPGSHNPYLMMFSFNRADNILDLPTGDEPEEWSHNFNDNFIVKTPALTRWVVFG